MAAESEKFINWTPDTQIAKASQGQSLLDHLIRLKVPINHTCGGNATCGTCVVHIENANSIIGSRNELEEEMAQDRGFHDYERLACQLDAREIYEKKISIKIPISHL